LFAGFTIAASCARAAPGSPEGKQTISKIAKFKLQSAKNFIGKQNNSN
jgi:hypothetical protein